LWLAERRFLMTSLYVADNLARDLIMHPGPEKILIIDDEPQMRRVLRNCLIAHGYEVSEAASGEEALSKLGRGDCDFILLDLNLPGMDGIETCRAIRSQSQVAIVIVSIRNSEKDKTAAWQAGANDYITKPFGIEELIERIQALGQKKSDEGQPS